MAAYEDDVMKSSQKFSEERSKIREKRQFFNL